MSFVEKRNCLGSESSQPRQPLGDHIANWVGSTLLVLLAFASAASVLLFDALCIGSCTDTPTAGPWTVIALGGAVIGTALLTSSRTRFVGRLLLTVPLIIALATTVG